MLTCVLHKSGDLKPSDKCKKKAQKKPKPLLQIECQNRQVNHDFAGMFQFRGHSAEGVTALADAKSTFNIRALSGFLPFQAEFLFANIRVLDGLPSLGPFR